MRYSFLLLFALAFCVTAQAQQASDTHTLGITVQEWAHVEIVGAASDITLNPFNCTPFTGAVPAACTQTSTGASFIGGTNAVAGATYTISATPDAGNPQVLDLSVVVADPVSDEEVGTVTYTNAGSLDLPAGGLLLSQSGAAYFYADGADLTYTLVGEALLIPGAYDYEVEIVVAAL